MKIVRVASEGRSLVGVLQGGAVTPVAEGDGRRGFVSVLDLARAANADPDLSPIPIAPPIPLADATLLAPLPMAPSVRDFYAFEQHVKTARLKRGLDMHPDWYELPVFYFSNPRAIVGPGQPVAIPPRSQELDYELEVAWVLSGGGRDLRPKDVDGLVAGFMVMNDWSARDIQRREMQLSMGPVKGKDFATSLGPWLVTASEFAPGGLREVPSAAMLARVNGVEYSRANLDQVYWSIAEMTCYASESATLVPGDVLGTGTCGTGCILELSLVHGADRYPWLKPGDNVQLEVEGLGMLENEVTAAGGPPFAPDPDRVRPKVTS